MADPITNIIACQFKIPLEEFEFAEAGNLSGPDLPGFASLSTGVVSGFVEGAFSAITIPLNALLSGPIKLLEWISEITTDFVGTLIDIVREYVLDPFIGKLKVWLPPIPFNIPGLGEIELPELNPDSPLAGDPSWLPQVDEFINMLLNWLTFPINFIIEVFQSVITQLTFPAINLDFLKDLWSKIVPAFGYVPNTGQYDAMSQMGECVMEELSGLIPPIFPSNAPQGPPAEGEFPANVGAGGVLIQPDGEISFAQGISSLEVNLGYREVDVDIEFGVAGAAGTAIQVPSGTLSLESGNRADENKSFTINKTSDPTLVEKVKVILKATPVDTPEQVSTFTFTVKSKSSDLLSDLQSAYDANGGTWDSHVNIFGIRDTGVVYDSSPSAIWNRWKDMIGMALFENGQWNVYMAQATLNASYRRIEWTNFGRPQPAMHFQEEFLTDVWYVGTHGSGGAQQVPGFQQALASQVQNVVMDAARIGRMGPGNVIRRQVGTGAQAGRDLGMNMHTTGPRGSTNQPAQVGDWSWGCQVWRNPVYYYSTVDRMLAVRAAAGLTNGSTGDKLSYMLLRRNQAETIWEFGKSLYGIQPPQD